MLYYILLFTLGQLKYVFLAKKNLTDK